MAAKLACGNTLDQIPNDITLKTPASFEPSIDYVVTKVGGVKKGVWGPGPRFVVPMLYVQLCK